MYSLALYITQDISEMVLLVINGVFLRSMVYRAYGRFFVVVVNCWYYQEILRFIDWLFYFFLHHTLLCASGSVMVSKVR